MRRINPPPIQYARTADGVNIAYQEVGDGPPALLLHPLHASHLTLDWDVPRFRLACELCGGSVRLIRYDPRQCGLSEDAEDLSLPAFVSDVRSVQTAVNVLRRDAAVSGLGVGAGT